MLDITVEGIDAIEIGLDKVLDLMSDLRPILEGLTTEIITPRFEDIFLTEGDGTWVPRLDNEPHPLLRDTGALFRSYTEEGAPGNVDIVTGGGLIFGSDLPRADVHEVGEGNISARPVAGIFFTPEIAEQIEAYFDRVFQTHFDEFGL